MDYFGEDTSALAPRPQCCDNCSRGLTGWLLSDLYEDVDDDGFHDFSKDAKTLLNVIQFLERNDVVPEKNRIKRFIMGKWDQSLRSVTYSSLYRCGLMREEHYWISLIEQLALNEFIETIEGTTTRTVSQKGKEWLRTSSPLRLKAIGQMYEFFQKKRSTPLVSSNINSFSSNAGPTSIPILHNFVPNNTTLSNILQQVCNAIATTKDIPFESIASAAALDKMVAAKPKNFDEFQIAALDGFTSEKLNKFGPTFVNAISKYCVS